MSSVQLSGASPRKAALLELLLRSMALFSVLLLILLVIMVPEATWWGWLASGVVISVVLWLGVFRPQWPFRVRVGLLLGALYLFACGCLLALGLTDEARLVLIVLPVFAVALLGVWLGTAVGLLTILTVWGAAVAQQAGLIPLVPEGLMPLTTAVNWLGTILYFGLMTLLALVALAWVLADIGLLLRDQQVLDKKLRAEREKLEQYVAVREQVLQTGIAVSYLVAREQEPLKLVTAVAEQVQRSIGYGRVTIFLQDETSGQLEQVANVLPDGREMGFQPVIWDWGDGVIDSVAGGQSVISVPQTAAAHWLTNENAAASALAASIAIDGKTVGIILVVEGERPLAQDDAALITAVADQLAAALQQRQAVAWAEEQVQQQALLNNINQQIQLSTSVEDALQVAARALGAALDSDRIAVEIQHSVGATAVDEGKYA